MLFHPDFHVYINKNCFNSTFFVENPVKVWWLQYLSVYLAANQFKPIILQKKMRMKRTLIYAIVLALFALTSCEKLSVETIDKDGYVNLTFNVKSVESAYKTRSTLADVKVTKLDFAIYSVEGDSYTLYKEVKQESSEDGFGTVSLDKIPYGTYRVVAIAHFSESHATMTDAANIVFTKLRDTFSVSKDITLTAESESNYSLELKRVTSKFILIATDTQPADVASLEIVLSGAATAFNPATGFASSADTEDRVMTADISGKANKSNQSYGGFSMFLTSSESKVKIIANFKDSSGKVLYTYTFDDVEMKQNRVTKYQGKIFTGNGFSFSVDDDWDTEYVKTI